MPTVSQSAAELQTALPIPQLARGSVPSTTHRCEVVVPRQLLGLVHDDGGRRVVRAASPPMPQPPNYAQSSSPPPSYSEIIPDMAESGDRTEGLPSYQMSETDLSNMSGLEETLPPPYALACTRQETAGDRL